MKEQQRNKRNNRLLTFNGETMCLMEWSDRFNINYFALTRRLNSNWSIEKALTFPIRVRRS